MEEERRRHRHEVEQMHWSYDQLKKTMSFLPSTIKGDSTLNINTNNSASVMGHYKDTDRWCELTDSVQAVLNKCSNVDSVEGASAGKRDRE